jgi:uncharacterized protein
MEKEIHFPLNTPFKPSRAIITLFVVDFILVLAFIGCFTALPALSISDFNPAVTAIIGVIALILLAFFVTWSRLYYDSMWYVLREDEMSWKRGVWFRTTGIVPYNRITNLDLRQGPVMRRLGISTLSIQTAGYSGQAIPEIKIEGIEHAEEFREFVRSMVRGCTTHSEGTGGTAAPSPKTTDQQILSELVRIRTLLEEKKI